MTQEKTFAEKLGILVHHWRHHNEDHCAEFAKWREEAARRQMTHILPAMDACLDAMRVVNERFAALEKTAEEREG